MNARTEANGPASSGAAPVQATVADDTPEARVKTARDAIDAVLRKLPDRGDDETLIELVYRRRLAISEARPRGLSDEELDEWTSEHDGLEERIGRLSAETFGDVEIKLTILCARLRENLSTEFHGELCDLMIAQCAHDDLRRLAGGAS